MKEICVVMDWDSRFAPGWSMVRQMDALGFGNCTNQYECEAACPKGVSVDNIAKLNRDYMIACASEAVGVFS